MAVRETNPSVFTPLRFLALGDSYTIGESISEIERWPVQLVEALISRGILIEQPEIIARTGWTTNELAEAIGATQIKPPYDLVSLLIGVNNQYRGHSREEYREEFAALLRRAISFAGGEADRVLVLSIPDWGVTPYAKRFDRRWIAKDINAFNEINRQETDRLGARYVDITSISRRAEAEPDLVASDDLHPSGMMYAEWVNVSLPVALEILDGGKLGFPANQD